MNPWYRVEFFFNPRIIGPRLKELLERYRKIPFVYVVLRSDNQTRKPYMRIDNMGAGYGIKELTEGIEKLKERIARQQKEDREAWVH